MDATNSSGGSVSWNSSVSNISVEPITLANTIDNTRALLKKKSLVQVINSYIKAGIEEGTRYLFILVKMNQSEFLILKITFASFFQVNDRRRSTFARHFRSA